GPAWIKGNGKVDVYGYVKEELIFHKKTGYGYSRKERDISEKWMLNRIRMDEFPLNTKVTLIIRAEGSKFGYPPFFRLNLRGPSQPYYHEIYQFNNSFFIFMFGVTFIILLYHILQYLYLREVIFLNFSVWVLFCCMTMLMSIGGLLDSVYRFGFVFWMFFSNGVYFLFWFFGRSFIQSKTKFPKLDKLIVGLATIMILQIIAVISLVLFTSTKPKFLAVGFNAEMHVIINILSLILSIVIATRKDNFARYFGIGASIGLVLLVIGSSWAAGWLKYPGFDAHSWGMFAQIVIFSFGIAFRRQKLNEKSELERLQAERSMAEVQRMKDLDEVKTRFFANISHEFRTPLTLINGPLQQAKRLSSDKHRESVLLSNKSFGVIKKNTARLQMLVDQLLDLSKIESGNLHLNLTKNGLMQFLRSQVFSFESMAERQNISLNTHFSEDLSENYYDKDKLEKIVNNLLSNAFKYTHQGGAVNVTAATDTSYVFIEIGDTGKGISKAEIDRIFDRFYRVEGSEAKGSGIGLALTKELVDLHNGQISVHSDQGRGTTFKVRLPITLAGLPGSSIIHSKDKDETKVVPKPLDDGVTQNSSSRAPVNSDDAVVLLVEDNKDLQEFISEILQTHYQVLTASDGLQGERMAFEHIPDLVISDVMMPKKDGYELCNSLKHNIKTSHIPIIMLTAKAGQSNKMEGLTQGADAYLTKPFDADELLLRTKNLIEARKKIWEHFKSMDLAFVDDLNLRSAEDTFLQKVMKTIKDNLDNELLSVEDIAATVGFSRAQLHRKLKALTNKSAGQLVSEVRLNEAKRMLENKIGSVSEIAYSVGYSNMSYFTKSFKEKFGVLPSKV
ncbi:MAG: ATP-binding protein, partial [Flavobacteriaceae bacterium]|nr:ATP-binding protein [Flavobacteriaceae bacterium]